MTRPRAETKTARSVGPQVPSSVRDEVLREAGYKCANPTCRNILTLQLHHIVWVKEGGPSKALNLLALCGHCHDLHTQGHIPVSAIKYWKGMLHAMNYAFSKESMDLLLFLYQRGSEPHLYTADGVLRFAGLFAADLVEFGSHMCEETFSNFMDSRHEVILSERGRQLVEAWRAGDESKYTALLSAPSK